MAITTILLYRLILSTIPQSFSFIPLIASEELGFFIFFRKFNLAVAMATNYIDSFGLKMICLVEDHSTNISVKILNRIVFHINMLLKDVKGLATSVDPDQTATFWVCIACSGLFRMKKYGGLWRQSSCGDWLFFNSVGGWLLWKCNSVGGCSSTKCSSLGILCLKGILWVVGV